MRSWARIAVVAVLCVAALSGCSRMAGGPPVAGSTGGYHLAQIAPDRWQPGPALRVSQVSTPPANQYEWTVVAVDPASRRLQISYDDGLCTNANRLEVEETARAVVVGISTTQSFSSACAGAAIGRATTITLTKPLGGRALMEGATGVNDGLPKVSNPDLLPDPSCSTEDGSPSDVPVGLAGATTRIAPTTATKAFVCRTWWPKGSAHAESTTISDPAKVASLAEAIDAGARDVVPGASTARCSTKHSRASWYDVYLQGPGVRVEVKTDAIWCDTITNGAASGTMTPALIKRLDALFPA